MSNWKPRDVAGLLLIVGAITMAYHNKESQPAPVPEPVNKYKLGEVILPDYAHSDTLIVVSPDSLEYHMNLSDGTDQSINFVLHKFCVPIGYTVPDYGVNVMDNGWEILDPLSGQNVYGHWGDKMDSIMINFND